MYPSTRPLFTRVNYKLRFELVTVMVSAVPSLSHAPLTTTRFARRNAETTHVVIAVRLDDSTRSRRKQGIKEYRETRLWGRATKTRFRDMDLLHRRA